jgi:hypothetical protein
MRRAAAWGPVARRVDEAVALLDTLPAREPTGRNGAREAAIAALGLVMDEAEARSAAAAWDDDTLRALKVANLPPDRAVPLLRRFRGDTAADLARRRGLVAELRERGARVSDEGAAHRPASVARFLALCGEHGADPAVADAIAETLRRRFPGAGPREVLSACEALFPRFAQWGDWLGAHSLLRALPTQREYTLSSFVDDFLRWTATDADAYVALQRYHRHESDGRSAAEILRLDRA